MDAYLHFTNNTFVLTNQSVSPSCFPKSNSNPQTGNPFQSEPLATKVTKGPTQHFANVKIHSDCSVVFITTESSTSTTNGQPTQGMDEESQSDEDGSGNGAPIGDVSIKKIKHSCDKHINLLSEENIRRPTGSFDQESDCSTHYESHSEGHNLPSSPAISYQSSLNGQRIDDLLLDDKFSLETPSPSRSEDESPAMEEATKIAKSYEGSCSRSSCRKSKALFSFMCKLGHSFDLTLEEVRRKWCSRCEKSLNNLREYATSFQGRVVNSYHDEKVTFECKNKHTWTIASKNAKKRWCSQCLKDSKKSAKQQLEEEHRRREMEAEEIQRQLFENARKQCSQPKMPSTQPTSIPNKNSIGSQSSVIQYFIKMEQEIDRIAKKKTSEFMKSQLYKGDITPEQILQVYKINAMPEEILKSYMLNLSPECLRAEFKRLAKMIHPDKNKHPEAGSAFQRVHKVYESALERSNASC